jgi:hypothetical protein
MAGLEGGLDHHGKGISRRPAFPAEIRRAKIAILGIEGETGSK